MKKVVWLMVATIVALVAYAVGSSSRADIDPEALSKAQASVDALSKSLMKAEDQPFNKSVLDSLKALGQEISKLGPESKNALGPSMDLLRKAVSDSTNGSGRAHERDLDSANEAAVAIRRVKSSLRELQVTRHSPTFWQAFGRDIRTAVNGFSAVGALTLVAVCVIVYSVFTDRGRSHVKSLIVSIGTLKVGNLELTFKGSGREATVAQIVGLSKEVNASLLGHSTNQQLLQRLESVMMDAKVTEALGKPYTAISDFRAVIQILDPLLSRTFFQITSYWPLNSDLAKRAGRRRSVHFGAMGRAWTDLKRTSIAQDVEGDLVDKYNMDPDEAVNRKEKSYAVICLPCDGSAARAVLYMDSSNQGQFPVEVQSLAEAIQAAASRTGLSDSIEKIYQELNCANPIIKIHEDADSAL